MTHHYVYLWVNRRLFCCFVGQVLNESHLIKVIFYSQTIVRGNKPRKDTSINGLLEEFDNISVTRSNSLRKESPPTHHQGNANHVPRHQEENGYLTYSQYSSESDTTADYGVEKYRDKTLYGEELDRYYKGGYATKQNGHMMKVPSRDIYYSEVTPLKSDLSRFLPDYQAQVEAKPKPLEYGGLKLEYQRIPSGSSLDYRDPFPYALSRASVQSECPKERLEYGDGDWGHSPGKDDYDKRPKSSYVDPASPQPAMRQRSRSGSGLQEPAMPYGASAFKAHQQGHSYSSYTYPRLSETAAGIPKVTLRALVTMLPGQGNSKTGMQKFGHVQNIEGKELGLGTKCQMRLVASPGAVQPWCVWWV